MSVRPWALGLAALWLAACPWHLAAQEPPPGTTTFPPPSSDEFDPQGRNSTVLGSGARALGMGGAFLARADDATAASWNPAGLSYLRRPEMSFVIARSTFDRVDFGRDEEDNTRGTSPDFASAAYPVSLWGSSGAMQLSFQRAIALDYSRSIARPDEPLSFGSQRNIRSNGGFDNIALGLGLRLSSKLRAGVTINRWHNGYELRSDRVRTETSVVDNTPIRTRAVQNTRFRIRSGTSVNLGVIVSPIENLNLGLVLKSPFTAGIVLTRSRQDFLNVDSPTPTSTRKSSEPDLADPEAETKVRLGMPGEVGFGVSWRPSSPVTVAADFTRTFWSGSEIRNYYILRRTKDEDIFYGQSDARYPDLPVALPFPNLDLARPGTALQRDAWQLRFGLEYVLITGRLRWPLRAGYFRDRQNFPASTEIPGPGDPTPPSTEPPTFRGVTAGIGVVFGKTLVDLAHIYEFGNHIGDRGAVRTRAHRTLVSVIYRFGEPR